MKDPIVRTVVIAIVAGLLLHLVFRLLNHFYGTNLA